MLSISSLNSQSFITASKHPDSSLFIIFFIVLSVLLYPRTEKIIKVVGSCSKGKKRIRKNRKWDRFNFLAGYSTIIILLLMSFALSYLIFL